MKLIIQIPCYNEAETLTIALDALPKHIDGIDEIEYLIINDGSVDETEKIARAWGVQHVVHFKRNLGLARGFLAGLDLAFRNGADIVVNTDADNQYCGEDIEKLQRLGSWFVRAASRTDIPDAPSGFRAYSRHDAMRMNVNNEYTYTLETIVQAERNKMAVISVV